MGASELLETQTRRNFVLELRKSGATYMQIADAARDHFGADKLPAGWDERYAYKDIARELEKLKTLNNGVTEDISQLEIERLDRMLRGVWVQAKSGNFGAIDRALKIMARRAALCGLDKPTQSHNLNLDMSALTTEQLERIAAGEDPAHVIATSSGG